MKKILLTTAAFIGLATASAQTSPSYVVEAITKKTDLYSESSPACNKVEAYHKSSSNPSDRTAPFIFVKTYKYTYSSIFDSLPKMQLEQSVSRFNNVKWDGASWKPWRMFDVYDAGIDKYTFVVEVIAPDYEEILDIDYTAVCITVLKLR